MHQPWHILWFYFNSFLNSITTLASIQLYKPVSRVYICSDWIRTQGRRTVPSRIWIHLTMAISKGQNANESGFIFAQMSSNQWRRQTLGGREREREREREDLRALFPFLIYLQNSLCFSPSVFKYFWQLFQVKKGLTAARGLKNKMQVSQYLITITYLVTLLCKEIIRTWELYLLM